MGPVLVTGFDPFGGEGLNSSWLAVQGLEGRTIAGRRLVVAQLPTEFARALVRLDSLLAAHRPSLVVCAGQAAGRSAVSIERVAINLADARIADNAGAQPVDAPVVPGGPAGYFATLPVKAMREALLARGVPAEISHSAGTFICNHVFYGLMHRLATRPELADVRGGFVHLPCVPEQAGEAAASVPLGTLVDGLHIAIETALTVASDLPVVGGELA